MEVTPMNRSRLTLTALGAIALAVGPALADARPATGPQPNVAFDKMKSLVGEWEGTTKDGKTVKVTYKLVADGSALMEQLETPMESTMITMYHPDGSRLLMTHYCSAHNQPRMRAEVTAPDPKSITFNFLDATNLSSPAEGHMERLVVSFDDPGHFTQEWTFRAKDQKQTDVFRFERKS